MGRLRAGEIAVAIRGDDLRGMLKARRATIQIPGKARRIRGRDLLDDVRDDLGRHIGRLRQKRAEKPNRAQLQCQPHPVAITTTLGDKTPV